MKFSLCFIYFLLFAIIPGSLFADNNWNEATSRSNIGSIIAKELADKLSHSLQDENSTVVYVNYEECNITKSWCDQFELQFENRLIENEISFLQQSKQDQIRSQITEELKRQQTSDLVNLDKIVELGKQEAIKAIITIKVTKETDSLFSANAKSINIERSVVTISKVSRIAVRKDGRSSISQNIISWSAIGLGSAALVYGLLESKKYSREGNNIYDDYRNSEDPDEIEQLRKDVKENDKKASDYQNAAMIGAVVAVGGVIYKLISTKTKYEYKFIAKKEREIQSDSLFSRIDTSLFLDKNALGLRFKVEI